MNQRVEERKFFFAVLKGGEMPNRGENKERLLLVYAYNYYMNQPSKPKVKVTKVLVSMLLLLSKCQRLSYLTFVLLFFYQKRNPFLVFQCRK